MKQSGIDALEALFVDYPALSACRDDLHRTAQVLIDTLERGGRVFVCGNGGSAADCAHITGELVKGYKRRRPLDASVVAAFAAADPQEGAALAARLQGGLPAMDLTAQSAVMTAIVNDLGPDLIFAQQLMAYAHPGDALLALSTSGTARNVNAALTTARALGMVSVALTGQTGLPAAALADVAVRVPAEATFRVQEYHLPVYHALCAAVEANFFED